MVDESMQVSARQLRDAVRLVRHATQEYVERGFFAAGVLTRLDQWIANLPDGLQELADALARKAAQKNTGSGADINGVALDQGERPSLEALVLHYDAESPGLFAPDAVLKVREKLASHGGPAYNGPWP